MAASYPSGAKSFTTKTNAVDTIDASHINDLQLEITAVESDLLSAVPTYITNIITGINAAALSTGVVSDGRLSGTYTNITANNATYAFGKSETQLNVNSAAVANNSTYAFGKSENQLNVNSATQATNAANLNSQPGSYYTNASNLSAGTIPNARLDSNIIFTTSTTGINASAISTGTVSDTRLPAATQTANGIVTTSEQTFGGTKTFHNDVYITGALYVQGNTIAIIANNITVDDSLIQLAANNTASDLLDIGLYGNYNGDGGAHEHTGLFRDASDDTWKLFKGLQTAPTAVVDTTGTGYTIATLQTYLSSGALTTNSSAINITANSSYSATLTVNSVTAQTLSGNLTGTASNATNLNSQPGSYYTNASNLNTGTIAVGLLHANVILTTSTTGINASALSTGTVPNARLSGSYTGITAITVANTATIGRVIENFQTYSSTISGTPTVAFDCTTGNIWNITGTISSNWTANFTNLGLANSYSTGVTLIVNQGATAYLPTAVQIEGNAVTLNWQAGTQPTPNANKKNIFAFSVLQTGASTYLVLGQLVSFG